MTDVDATVKVAIGEFILSFEGQTLTIARRDSPANALTAKLDALEIERLASFLGSLTPLEDEDERRLAFRIPVAPDAPLHVRISTDESTSECKALNVSLSGILVVLPLESPIALAIDDAVGVHLEYESYSVQVRGQVKRLLPGGRYGLFFPDSMTNGKLRPPANLSRLVMAIQRNWLSGLRGAP